MKVLLIEDQRMLADALAGVLRTASVEVTSVVGSGDEAIEAARRVDPDVVLVDVERRGEDGVALGRELVADPALRARVVGLASECRPDLVETVTRAGFRGLVTREAPAEELVDGLRSVLDGTADFVNARNGPRRRRNGSAGGDAAIDRLTPRELEVLRLLATAETTASIADRLGISQYTVRAHVQNLLTKLGVHSRLEAAALAMRLGVASPARAAASSSGHAPPPNAPAPDH